MAQNPRGKSMVPHRRSTPLPCDILNEIISLLNFPRSSTIKICSTTFTVIIFEPVAYNFSEFWNILDNIFTLFTTPSINTFRIRLPETLLEEPFIRPILHSWARRLRARNFKHVEIYSYKTNKSCSYYHTGHIVCPPSILEIPSLVSLDLCGLVSYGILEWVLSNCPSIEDLSFDLRTTKKDNKRPVLISGKNLKRLRITHVSSMSSSLDFFDIIIDAPTLEHLDFEACSFLSMQMFDLIPNVKSVEIFGNSKIKLHNNSPTKIILPSLTNLRLPMSSEIFKAIFDQQMLHCPNLEDLELRFFEYYWYDSNWVPKDMCVLVENVKHLELHMRVVQFDQRTLNFVTWLLRSAPVLEKLILVAAHGRSYYGNDILSKAKFRGSYYGNDILSKAQFRGWYYGNDILSKAQFRKTLFECAKDSSGCQIELIGKWNKLEY